jgi:hypothetical protein
MFRVSDGSPIYPDCHRRVVPGSEVVTGPDMTPGLATSEIRMVRYQRVPFNLGRPGINQYKIDYGTNDASGATAGWIFFSPASDESIPEKMGSASDDTTIDIRYKYQVNRDGDVITGNYSTRTLLTVTMGIRYYDRSSGKVQPIELTNQVRVRNLMR